jgi:predicted  nucleic acid-binding Zn-ribbon protein
MSSTPFQTREERAEGVREWVGDVVKKLKLRGAADVIGISVGAIRNLLDDNKKPHERTLKRLEAAMIRYEKEQAVAEVSTANAQNGRSADLESRLDQIAAEHRNNPYLRMLERENLLAVYLAHAIDRAERAAEIRAGAIKEAERGSSVRAEAVRDAERASAARADAIKERRLPSVLGIDQLPPEHPAKRRRSGE